MDQKNYKSLIGNELLPEYDHLSEWEFYAANFLTEYNQSIEEGLDIEKYQDLFLAAAKLPRNKITKQLGDVIFKIIQNAEQKPDYPYIEPSDLEGIQALRKPYDYRPNDICDIASKVHGAWLGRVCGCMLGKTVEGIRTEELIPFLKETGNYPMHRYILRSDINDTIVTNYKYGFINRDYVDTSHGMPADDDTNYAVLYQELIEKYGRDFTPYDVAKTWLDYQPKNAYCTAERVAYCNFVKGMLPPESATYQNPYREWIGAQIRGDYFGYINPGNPELAAEMAWRDASISHTKNGIYGEMFVAAMLAVAAATTDRLDILMGGLAQIPHTSRLYAEVLSVIHDHQNGVSREDCFKKIHEKYDEHTAHGWCHTISNAMIVAAALLYGQGDYSRSICMAVEIGFDTDCNAATVGSILGMAYGVSHIPVCWSDPIQDTLHTSIFGIHQVKISERAQMTMKHIL